MASRSFEDLEVWQKACRLCEDLCRDLFETKPASYAFRDQMIKSALSIPSNIAEGSERDSTADFSRFLKIAKGSSAELRTQLYLSSRLELLPRERASSYIEQAKSISAMLQALIRSITPSS